MSRRLTLILAAPAILAIAGPAPVSAQTATDLCFAQAREQAKLALEGGATREAARFVLEREIIPCVRGDADAKLVNLYAYAHFDRALFARQVLAGQLTLAHYFALVAERQAKLERLLGDPDGQEALLNGDRDRDLVPDERDRCPDTQYGLPTDENGCPVAVPPPNRAEEENWRRLIDNARQLHNPDCEDAPPPQTPQPLEWGRGGQPQHGTVGFNIAVAKVGGMPDGCELFYEIHFEFFDPAAGNLPPTKHVNVVFREGEDLLPAEPLRATFGLAVNMPITSAGRAAARQAMAQEYQKIRWRVRAVNGGNLASPWSAVVVQGPALLGVPPLP
jgi:hypothetical protein